MKKFAFALMLALSSVLLPSCHAADENKVPYPESELEQ